MSAATVAAIAKAAVAVLSNEKTRKALGWVIVAILSPLIVLVVLICAVLSGSSQHNVSAVELCFPRRYNFLQCYSRVPRLYRKYERQLCPAG